MECFSTAVYGEDLGFGQVIHHHQPKAKRPRR
jgi:hypothetical protein